MEITVLIIGPSLLALAGNAHIDRFVPGLRVGRPY
jgi:hypothetical protein